MIRSHISVIKGINPRKWGIKMDANVNYLGLLNLLHALQDSGLISKAEAKRVAARLKVDIGADIVIPV